MVYKLAKKIGVFLEKFISWKFLKIVIEEILFIKQTKSQIAFVIFERDFLEKTLNKKTTDDEFDWFRATWELDTYYNGIIHFQKKEDKK